MLQYNDFDMYVQDLMICCSLQHSGGLAKAHRIRQNVGTFLYRTPEPTASGIGMIGIISRNDTQSDLRGMIMLTIHQLKYLHSL